VVDGGQQQVQQQRWWQQQSVSRGSCRQSARHTCRAPPSVPLCTRVRRAGTKHINTLPSA
jgi:hypothetical protein